MTRDQVLLAFLIGCAAAFVIWQSLRSKSKLLLFGLSWYAAPMIPATHLLVIGTLVAERLLYVPLAGWSIFLGYVCKVRKSASHSCEINLATR